MSKRKSPIAIVRDVPCTCDVCGKQARCADEEPCPPGWLFSQPVDGEELTACSKACAASFWTQNPEDA